MAINTTTPRTTGNDWYNPAAAAAMKSSVDLLKGVEDGIVRNFDNLDRVKAFTNDLSTTSDMFGSAQTALSGDASKENDQFVPLIDRAQNPARSVYQRLTSKEIVNTWPAERNEILSSIRSSKAIASNVADQLSPPKQ
jgi:hypothetical protein